MWSFLRNRKAATQTNHVTKEEPQRPKSLDQLRDNIWEEDYSDLIEHDVALKFWLPEPAKHALDEISQITDQPVSGFLRQFLVIHCYGFYPYLMLLDIMPDFCKHDNRLQPPSIRFSRSDSTPEGKKRESTYWVADLGKNIAPVKLWVPTRLKQDLSILAEHTGLTLSNYIREIVISRLLGHGMLPKRPEMMTSPTPNAANWLDDGALHWTEVDEDTYETHPIKEVRNTWVDDPEYSPE